MDRAAILARLSLVPGDVGFYYKNLVTGETIGVREDDAFLAASVIKLPIMVVAMQKAFEGSVPLSEKIVCRHEDKVPPCGALYFFTDEPVVDIQTLLGLMITISDNTATNLLINHYGLDALNEAFRALGLCKTHLERRLFDRDASLSGRQNYITPKEMGMLLEKIYCRTLVSDYMSEQMESILLEQQINHKIPGYLRGEFAVAHKTGEDSGTSNDVGIVYADEPFVIAFATNRTDVPEAERAMREITLALSRLPAWEPESVL